MIARSNQILVSWFVLSDAVLLFTSWLVSYWVRFDSGWIPLWNDVPELEKCFFSLPWVVGLGLLAFQMTGQYTFDRMRRLREEMVGAVKGTALATLFVATALFMLRGGYESRAALLVFFLVSSCAVVLGRRCGWSLVRTFRRAGWDVSFALVVGTGRVARRTARSLRRTTWMGIRPVGFIEDQPGPQCSDLDVLGKTEDLPKLIEKYRIGHVFVALPMNRHGEVRRVFDVLASTFADVRLVPDIPGMAGLTVRVSNLDGQQLVSVRENPYYGLNVVFKRCMDVFLSLFGLIVISPLLACIALLVKLTSPGPVLFRQERCGLNGASFMMLKFRSMRVDAEKSTGAIWARKGDDRTTPLGRFLRATSLDELPQLWNVLVGDMSLVGPRPERPVFTKQFSKSLPTYMARHAVKAGLTGWAQVNGWRGNTSLRKRLQYDLYYIIHWTPWLDLKILWLTVFHGFRHKNAY
jgi:Undecaprenyl-phosphate glucose phosphotransferase